MKKGSLARIAGLKDETSATELLLLADGRVKNWIHAVWVIRNGYKKRFCKLVKILKKIRNEN